MSVTTFHAGDIVKIIDVIDPEHEEESKKLLKQNGFVTAYKVHDSGLNVQVLIPNENVWYCKESALHTILPNYAEHSKDLKGGE